MNVMGLYASLGKLIFDYPQMATAKVVDVENPDYEVSSIEYKREHDAVCIEFKEE
ncbi:hypothetical protein [Sporanaerobium hydrogeniformans]|uniref:hypothetical protein n=1 Tax=Sporanaerobium hydrogeniformans TaxID=3072179 RepID=UPI0015D4A162|nr:hypothetical protein [Sporanaerobium hydrogeniformans]